MEVRKQVLARLAEDMLGPRTPDEVLEGERVKPSDFYLTGILSPTGSRMDAGDDDGSDSDSDDDDGPSSPSLVGQQRPATMGLSFATRNEEGPCTLSIAVSFGTYAPSVFEDAGGRKLERWTRTAHRFDLDGVHLPVNDATRIPLKAAGLVPDVELHVRGLASATGMLATVTLINRTVIADPDRTTIEERSLFQTMVEVRPESATRIVPRPERPFADDEDRDIARLLYRNVKEFAAGHQCSADWDAADDGTASCVRTSWIPTAEVPAVRESGSEVFAQLVKANTLDAALLATTDDADLIARLRALTTAYRQWIAQKAATVAALPQDLATIAGANLKQCGDVCSRMESGIDAMANNDELRLSFRLANAAMALQNSWKPERSGIPLAWRPFQIGFILLSAESTCRPQSDARHVLDLLWFPTGGGKTEAYLAIIAMLAFHRRLVKADPDDGAGNAAVMRYTLRLLTAQQFERAAALILAAELIRRGTVASKLGGRSLGDVPFSIGLWVGGDATPNNFVKALETRGLREGTTAEQITTCPCCRKSVRWKYSEGEERVDPTCENPECLLGPAFGRWPVHTVDSDVYRERPTLVIGTIDKFALLPTRKEMSGLFGFRGDQGTDLIIQDELHLISGPLGTVAGLYETAFDWLLTRDGRRPKVIGSTATIRRAASQIRAVFDRDSCQFPPPGLEHDDSGFAIRDDSRPGRLYASVTTAGRSAKFALQAAAASLMQSAGPAATVSDAERDGYATLLAYFNSLRELGGAIVQMLDDVPDAMSLYAGRRGETPRVLGPPKELTSRVSQMEIVRILADLSLRAGETDAVDVVLATNMVSVGVDVPRLGLMLVNGQPKTRSEYIQATSRVGRSAFPGLIVGVLNASKPRDRSHYETFVGWHRGIYREVEATSVTPFAPRARDRALHAVLVAMLRHGVPALFDKPDLENATDEDLAAVVDEIERRIGAVDARELASSRIEIDGLIEDWMDRRPKIYLNPRQTNQSLLQSADQYARRTAMGRAPVAAWPTMNNMRSVEPTSRFRMAEHLAPRHGRPGAAAPAPGPAGNDGNAAPTGPQPRRWRR